MRSDSVRSLSTGFTSISLVAFRQNKIKSLIGRITCNGCRSSAAGRDGAYGKRIGGASCSGSACLSLRSCISCITLRTLLPCIALLSLRSGRTLWNAEFESEDLGCRWPGCSNLNRGLLALGKLLRSCHRLSEASCGTIMSLWKLEVEPELLSCIRSCGSDCYRCAVGSSEKLYCGFRSIESCT